MFCFIQNCKKSFFITLTVFILIFLNSAQANAPVLVFHSYHSEYAWTKAQMRGFTDELNSQSDLFPKYSIEELDTKRIELSESYEKTYEQYIKAKYAHYQPKLIYVTDDNALHFVIHWVRSLFPMVPVVFSGINDRSMLENVSDELVKGVFEVKEIVPNLELIENLFPKEKEVLILGDLSHTSQKTAELLKSQLVNNSDLSKWKIKLANEFESVLETVEASPATTIILSSIGAFKSPEGRLIPVKEAIATILEKRDFNIFSLEESYIQGGVLGGYANRGYLQGKEAAQIALQMTSLSSVVNVDGVKANQWIFDSQALKNNHISLPKEIAEKARYINVEASFFSKNEKFIKAVLVILSILFVSITVAFFLYLIKSRKVILTKQHLLTETSKRLNLAQRISKTGNWEWDIFSNELWWSDQTYRLFGLKPKQIEPNLEQFLKFIHRDDVNKLQDAIENAIDSRSDYKIIHRINRADGQVIFVEEQGWLEFDDNKVPVKMNGTIKDITEQHEAELTLKMQANIIDTVQDSVMVHDLKGHFIYLNRAAWETRGYSKQEMLALSVSDIDTPEYRGDFEEKVVQAVEVIKAKGAIKIQVEHLRKDGSAFPVEVFATLINVEGRDCILSSVRDISEQVENQKALEFSEKKYRNLVENAMVGVYETTLSGRVLYANAELAEMLGYESTEDFDKYSALNRYEDLSQRSLLIEKIIQNKIISNFKVNLLNKSGESIPVLLSASLEGNVISGTVVDLSEIFESRKRLEIFSQIIEQVDDSVMVTDKDGVINYVNPAFTQHTGYSEEDVLKKHPRVIKSGVHDELFYKDLWETISSGKAFNAIVTNAKKDGGVFYENKTITPLLNDSGQITGYVSTGKDVTQETLFNQKVSELAATDKLTGLFNRHKFEELYSLEEERAKRDYQALSMILVDIDLFKSVNDKFGHDMGDCVLIEVAQLLKNNTRNIDILARWGGEEFLILCPGTDIKNVYNLAEKLRREIEQYSFSEVGNVTISLGVGSYSSDLSFKEFFKLVDDRLYFAKSNGRNQVCCKGELELEPVS